MKNFTKHTKNEKGLTLIELLAVIVIIAIIAAIAVPAIGNVINNSRDKSLLADASNIMASAKIAMVDGACTAGSAGAVSCTQDDLASYVQNVKKDAKYTASLSATAKDKPGEWTVKYDGLGDIKNEKYKPETDGSVSESELNELMDKKEKATTKP